MEPFDYDGTDEPNTSLEDAEWESIEEFDVFTGYEELYDEDLYWYEKVLQLQKRHKEQEEHFL